MERDERMQKRIFYVLDKIALELDQSSSENSLNYWTECGIEFQMKGLQNNPNIPNPREEVQILEKLESEGILKIKSNHGEYE